MAARHAPSDEGGIDWRRLASDRNVSHVVARGLWDRARATAPDDPVQAERAFTRLLEEAANANVTNEPGRETLVDATPGADASSLGPGKWTRVLLEEQKPSGGSAKRGTETAKPAPVEGPENGKQAEPKPKASAEGLRNDLLAAVQASKNAAALLATSDPATIVEALRELRETEGPGLLQKIMSVAGGAIERILGQRLPDPETQPAGPVGERVQFSVGDEVHTQYVDDDGVPMMASTPKPVATKVEEWRANVATQPPAVQQRVAPELARATGLATTAADQAKRAKAGDQAAKAALPATQQQLGSSLGTISRQVGAEPNKPPAPPAAALAPSPVAAAPDAAAKGPAPTTPSTPTATPAVPPTATVAAPDPAAAKQPPDPAAVKAADDLLHKVFHTCGKLPPALGALAEQQRIDESAKPAADLRLQHFPTFESLKVAMSPTAVEKANQIDLEKGLELGAEGLLDKFKGDVLAAFHAGTYATAASFETLFNEVAKRGYTMKGKQLLPADFNAAVPAEQSLARVINTDGAFSRFLDEDRARRDWSMENPGDQKATSDELTAYVLQKAQADAPAAVKKYVKPTIVDFPSWLFPEPDIKADAVFSQYCDLLALYANWYPKGHLRMVVKRAAVTDKITKGGLRKPTVFDGTLSPLWMQRDNRDHNWGKTGGGLREALMKVDWVDIDHTKWVLVAMDPKYQAVITAQRAKAAKTATPADAKTIADHEKAMVSQSETAQGAQRADDGAAKPAAPDAAATEKPAGAGTEEQPEKVAADPIVVPTTMAGTPHTLTGDPGIGKVGFNSIAGWVVEKLQSVVDLVPPEARVNAASALATATEAAAIVVDPALKPGAKPSERPPVLQRLGDTLKELATRIRILGDSGRITDANPEIIQRARVDEEMRLRRMAQPAQPAAQPEAPAPAAAPTTELAPGSASTVVEPAPNSPAAQAKANAPAAAAATPQQGGFQANDQRTTNPGGRTPEQTAAVATADPQFGGAKDTEGRATETVAQAAERLHPGERDSNFNPKAKVEFEAALAREILANPGLYSAEVYEISGKVLAYFDAKSKAGFGEVLQELAKLETSSTWFGHIKTEVTATATPEQMKEQIGGGIQLALRGRGNIPQHLAAHQLFLDRVLTKDWTAEVTQQFCRVFVGEAAVHPTYVREQTKIANGELNKSGAPVFDKAHASERGRVDRPNKPTPIAAAAGPVPKNTDGSDPAPLLPDGKTNEGTSAGTTQTINRGIDLFTMDEAKAFVQRARLQVNMPLIAGISGSTAELINCAMTLGLGSESLHKYALAVVGYISGGGNHSFIEIATVLKAAGLPVNPDSYDGFYPSNFAAAFQALKRQFPQAFPDAAPATALAPDAPVPGPTA